MSTSTEPPERVRPRLERLRKTLRHWQICSDEYETLRRELSTLSPKGSREDMLTVGAKFGGKLVDEKEIKSLLGDELGIKRTVVQVITEISHRINYAQENVMKFEQQIEQGENETDENEEDEEDEYEAEDDPKYQPTTEGLVSPELRIELEEFQKRIRERGEAARAEEAKWAAEEKKKPKKKRKGGVRFAEEPEEVPATAPKPLPLLAQTTRDTTPIAENLLATDTNDKPEGMKTADVNRLMVEVDDDTKLQSSIAEEVLQSPRSIVPTAAVDKIVHEDPPTTFDAPIEPTNLRLPKLTVGEAVPNSLRSAHTPPPSG